MGMWRLSGRGMVGAAKQSGRTHHQDQPEANEKAMGYSRETDVLIQLHDSG